MAPLRVAVFAEGSVAEKDLTRDPFTLLWTQVVRECLKLRAIDAVYPIDKRNLIAMSPEVTIVGVEPLDELMERRLRTDPFDAAVVAWDLYPRWQGLTASACRWEETVEFYRLLGGSSHLPGPWTTAAALRHADLVKRPNHGTRAAPPQVSRFGILAVCMEPTFEGLLVADQAGVKRALGAEGEQLRNWPPSWNQPGIREPGRQLLQPAIKAARDHRPRLVGYPPVRGDMITAKHEWGSTLLRALTTDARAAPSIAAHPLAVRLRELLPGHVM